MTGFLLRLAVFGVCFVASGYLLKLPLNYGWGNATWMQKRELLRSQEQPPDMFFVGSSRILRHLAPTVFDSVMAANGAPTRSFNLGLGGNFPPETYHLLIGAVEEGDIPPGSTVLAELSQPAPVEAHMVRSVRASYFQSPANWLMLARYAFETRSVKTRWPYLRGSTLAFLRNTFHIGQMKAMLKSSGPAYAEDNSVNVRGYTSLDHEVETTSSDELREFLLDRRSELLADTLLLMLRRDSALMVRSAPPGPPSAAWKNAIDNVEATCSRHSVRLIWFVPPRRIYEREWDMLHALGAEKVLDMSDPAAYPTAFQLRYCYDRGHFNQAGALIHTANVALLMARRTR